MFRYGPVMRRLLELYLPVLFPYWRFFEEIGASPRVEYRVDGGPWIEATARPDQVTWQTHILSLFWNRAWNERLFFVTLAERILMGTSVKASEQLASRLSKWAGQSGRLVYRIRLVDGDGDDVVFESVPYDI